MTHEDNERGRAPAAPEVKPIDAPTGIELNPEPEPVARVSRRAGLAIGIITVLLLIALAYGGYRRSVQSQAVVRDRGKPKNVAPATAASNEVTKGIPAGVAPIARVNPQLLQPPESVPSAAAPAPNLAPCGSDPRTGQPYRFNPLTGQPCSTPPIERVVVRQAPPASPRQPVQQSPIVKEPSPEEKRLLAAYHREQEAAMAPTGIRAGGVGSGGSAFSSAPGMSAPSPANDLAQIAALGQALAGGKAGSGPSPASIGSAFLPQPSAAEDYDAQNMQTRKEAFIEDARNKKTEDYLRSTRNAPLSDYEIKAGWEIPAVLEQALNSDLPGEIKALVAANVYDTATGRYLLIPQGSRLIGKYDSRIAYGQNGVQVAWDRVVFPDASSVDLRGMAGLDAQGNAGLRHKVDRHYMRLLGFSALTSLFSAAITLSQRQQQSLLAYPTVGETAAAAAAREMSQTGSMITRRNLNVQPTIKVPVGYKFTVRVNRDILFEAPYEPLQADPEALPGEKQLRRRSSL